MGSWYRKLETSSKKREIYVPNRFFIFYILQASLSERALSCKVFYLLRHFFL